MRRDNNCTNLHNDGSDLDNRNYNDSFGHDNANVNFKNHNNFIHRTNDVFAYNDSNDNYFDFYHDVHYGFHFNNQNHHDNYENHNDVNDFSFINNYNCASDNNHDSIHALDN